MGLCLFFFKRIGFLQFGGGTAVTVLQGFGVRCSVVH